MGALPGDPGMWRVVSVVLFAWSITPAIWARDEPPQGPRTPRERYQALVREQQKAEREFWGAYGKIKSREERDEFFAQRLPRPGPYVRRFLEIAESAPQDQASVDSLIWIVSKGGCEPEVKRAVERLAANHAGNKRLGMIAPRMIPNLIFSLSPSAETSAPCRSLRRTRTASPKARPAWRSPSTLNGNLNLFARSREIRPAGPANVIRFT